MPAARLARRGRSAAPRSCSATACSPRRRALRPAALHAAGRARPALRGALLAALALTWLNPHVYLDTVLLLGSVAADHGDRAGGSASAGRCGSVLWFAALGYGARLLRRCSPGPAAWRVLDGAIALIMVAIGLSLVI